MLRNYAVRVRFLFACFAQQYGVYTVRMRTTLTAEWNAFGRPLAVRADSSSRSEQFEAALACVRCDGVLFEVLVVECDGTVSRRAGKAA